MSQNDYHTATTGFSKLGGISGTESNGNLSATNRRTQGGNIADRLYKEAERKKQQKEQYEQEKIKRETSECTFVPNKGKSQSRKNLFSTNKIGASKQLNIQLFSGNGETEIRNVSLMEQ